MDMISVPTRDGWVFAVYIDDVNPRYDATSRILHSVVTPLFWSPDPAFPEDRRERILFSISDNIVCLERPAPELASTCAPHVLKDYVDARATVPMTNSGEVDLDAWLHQRPPDCSEVSLAEALDGGRKNYLRLCWEDILRILLDRYDNTPIRPRGEPFQVPDEAEMTVQQLQDSPLKRRYYRTEIWQSEAARLFGEGLIDGHGDAGPFWVKADRVAEIREKVSEWERRALAGDDAGSSIRRFFMGERSKAWQELRETWGRYPCFSLAWGGRAGGAW